ncbi:MAG: choice-of-anchor D domain-containing protein [Candidatus Latescibacterota bacterium]|nr:choice-of-anchor D domain-containing protein [Candidatus Latescibacterota bacterium]
MQEEIVDVARDKDFEMVGVDLWNGSASQLNEFQFVTQVKFPLLQKGTNSEIPWGLGVENIIVVDPDGIIRGILSVADRDKVVELIDLINDPTPISDLKPKSLYWGTKSEVGVDRIITITVENTGLKPLDVQSIRSTSEQVMVDRTSFTVQPRESETFVVTLSPAEAGRVSGSVEVVTNEKNWTLPISEILIEGSLSPAIVLSATLLDFGTVEVGRSLSQTIEIRNDGLGPLKVTGLEADINAVSFSEQTFTVGVGETKAIIVSVKPSSKGMISGIVNVLSDDPENGTLSFSLAGSAQIIPADARTDFDGNGTVNFRDFLSFASAFGTSSPTYDINQNGVVDFSDFLIFAENFGRSVQ